MATYSADAVALLYYLLDALPPAADTAFRRAESGIDVIRAPDVQVAEVLNQIARGGVVAGLELQGAPSDALRLLVADGPVGIDPIDTHELAVYGSIADQFSMHDGLLVATHRVRGGEAIITNDAAFDALDTVWD